jgi:uncharacterized MAPEG superfamily protein
MTIALWCVLIAAILPIAATSVAKAGGERFNNREPRAWLERQTGFRKRAHNAQANSFEAFPFFAAAVIVAHMLNAPQQRVDLLAVTFIVARIAYLVCYLADWHWPRSFVWFVGWLSCIFIFVSASVR